MRAEDRLKYEVKQHSASKKDEASTTRPKGEPERRNNHSCGERDCCNIDNRVHDVMPSTFRLTDPRRMMPGIQHRRHRGVRCIRFVRPGCVCGAMISTRKTVPGKVTTDDADEHG